MLLPAMVVTAGIVVYPMAYSLYVSFTRYNLLRPERTSAFVPSEMFDNYVVRLAGDGDTTWSEPVPSSAAPLPVRLCRLDSASGENRNVYYYVGHTPRDTRMIRLVWRDGEPLVEDGPDIEG